MWLYTVVLVAIISHAAAADQLWASGTPHGVELLWLPPQDQPLSYRYTIRRSLSGTNRWNDIGSTTATLSDPQLDTLRQQAQATDPAIARSALAQLAQILLRSPRRIAPLLGTYFLDTTTTPGTEYDYQVWAGAALVASIYGVVSHQRSIPEPPAILRARQRWRCIELWWSTDSAKERGIIAYAVYRADEIRSPVRLIPEPLPVASLGADTVQSCLVRDCSIGTLQRYTYYVAALNVFGSEGQPASVVMTTDTTISMQPVVARVESAGEELHLVVRASDASTRRYTPIVRTSNTRQWSQIPFVRQDSILRLAPIVSTADAVAVAVICTDSLQHSWLSIPITVPITDTTAPERPVYCQLDRKGSAVTVQWTPVRDLDVAGCIIESVIETDTIRRFVPAEVVAITDTTSEPCRYRIIVADAHGNLSRPTPWTRCDLQHIECPELIAVRRTERGTLVVWRSLSGATRILVNRYDDTTATPITVATLDGTATSYVDRNHSAAGSWYQIVALDRNGRYSMPSRRLHSSTLKQCKAPIFTTVRYDNGVVTLTWDQSTEDYVLERIEAGTDDIVVLARLGSADHSFTDGTVASGVTYTYRLRCIGESDTKEISSLRITIPPPQQD